MPVMFVSPKPIMHTFYVSTVNGQYITQGDIVIDSDDRRKNRDKTLHALQTNNVTKIPVSSRVLAALRKDLVSTLGAAKSTAIVQSLEKHGVFSPFKRAAGSKSLYGVYIPSNAAASGYACSEACGIYLPTVGSRWKPPIPYCVSRTASAFASNINDAISMWHSDTGITFSKMPDNICAQYDNAVPARPGMIWFISGDGCNSYVGRLVDYVNVIHLRQDCADLGGVLHEIGHALGLYHEQDRPDRDNYMTLKPQNILPGFENQFSHDAQLPYALYGTYDCDSIMQYGVWAFSKRYPPLVTLEPKPGTGCDNIGQRDHLSKEDVQEVKFMYNL